jgi:hypothetical protein
MDGSISRLLPARAPQRGRRRSAASWLTHVVSLIAVLLSPTLHAQSSVSDAVWRSQELNLTYRADTTLYTCGDLVRRVTAVLRAVGAREDLRIQGQCSDFARHQLLSISLATPIEANPENVRLVTTYDATQRLLAELRGETLPSATDVERFAATRKVISLTRATRHSPLTNGDCALLQSIREQLFAPLEVRVHKSRWRCTREATHTSPVFAVEALVREQAAPLGAS